MDELDELLDWLELLEELELLDWLELLEELELLLAVGILDEELGILGEELGMLLDEVLGMLGADELDELGILGMLEDDDELEEDWQPTRAVMVAPTSTGAI